MIHRQRVLGQRPRNSAKTEEQIRSRNGDSAKRCDDGSTETNEDDRHPGSGSSAGKRWKDEVRPHEEITEAPMLNEETKKATVTEMVRKELATHLKS